MRAMQALGSYRRGRMLFLRLGTGSNRRMIIDGVLEPMELAHLPLRKGRHYGTMWNGGASSARQEAVAPPRGGRRDACRRRWRPTTWWWAAERQALKTLPAACGGATTPRLPGGLRLWDDRRAHADGVRAHDAHGGGLAGSAGRRG